MDKAKYIIIESDDFNPDDDGRRALEELLCSKTPIVFPTWLSHDGVARSMTGGNLDRVLSAGFVTVTPKRDYGIQVACFGRSEGLNIESKKGDSDIVARSLGIETSTGWY